MMMMMMVDGSISGRANMSDTALVDPAAANSRAK
jgi:hypothetical protein